MTSRISIDVITLLRELRCMSIYDNDQNEFSTYSCGNRVSLIARGLRSKLGGAAPEKKTEPLQANIY